MEHYRINITRPAEQDLTEILHYVANSLKNPAAAARLYADIKAAIRSLNQLPERCRVVDDEPYATQGIRRLFVRNYVVFFTADPSSRTVTVLRVVYNRREWQSLLGED